MSAQVPALATPDESRGKRLIAAYLDADVTTKDMRARGFTTADILRMKEKYGPKPTSGQMPRPAKWSAR